MLLTQANGITLEEAQKSNKLFVIVPVEFLQKQKQQVNKEPAKTSSSVKSSKTPASEQKIKKAKKEKAVSKPASKKKNNGSIDMDSLM